MSTPDRYTLLARRAVAEVNKHTPRYAKLIMDGGYDDHIEMRVALNAVELALNEVITIELAHNELVRPEGIQTMLATGMAGCVVAKTKDGGLTWTSVPYEEYYAEVLGDKPLAATD